MIVVDISILPVPENILNIDGAHIKPPMFSTGGDALNVAVSLKKLGIEVNMCGRIGKDNYGNFIKESLSEIGISLSNIIEDKTFPTAVSYVLIDTNGERHFLTNNDIFTNISCEDAPKSAMADSDIVYFGSAIAVKSMTGNGICSLFKKARSLGKITVLDAAVSLAEKEDYLKKLSDAFYQTDYFLPSLDEAFILTGEKDPYLAARHFKKFGMKAFGVKLGKQGVYITDFKDEKIIPCIKDFPVVDTTGAGDSFVAGFICALTHGFDIFDSAAFGNVIASFNVGKVGATAGVPTFNSGLKCFESFF